MDVSPETIRTVEFRERLRGYNQDDVDEFLERMAAGVEILQQRLRDATERATRAEEQARQPDGDESLRRTLALAQRTADLAVEEAREQAARLLESAQGEAHSAVAAAQAEADAIVRDAEQRAVRIIEDGQSQALAGVRQLEALRDQLNAEVAILERHVVGARSRAQSILAEAARQVEHLLADPAPPAVTPEVKLGDVPSTSAPAPVAAGVPSPELEGAPAGELPEPTGLSVMTGEQPPPATAPDAEVAVPFQDASLRP
jgi:cell division initiation protein